MHCDRGTSGRIGGALMLYMAMRLPRPTTSTSLWPAVTRTASRAPSRSSAVLVATVVPCTMRSSFLASTPSRPIPARMPSDWLRGVDGVFKHLQLAGRQVEQHQIRERAADVDAEPEHPGSYRPVKAGLRFSRNARAPSR